MMKDSGIEWVGSIPDKWDVIPAGGLFTEIKEKNKNLKYTNPLQFRFGTIVDKAYTGDLDESLLETLRTYTCVEPDTIMLNGLNLNYDFISQRVGIVTKPGVITSAYLAVYPDKKRILPRYANYLLKAYDSIFVFHGMGSGVRKTLQWKDFKNLKFVLPSIEEQATIIKALDSLCAKTDTLIANVQTQIEKLKAYKQSLITEVVTKGLDPTVPMKDSEVEWMGDIPAHWDIKRGKALFRETEARSVDGTEELLTVSQYTGITPRSQKNVTMFEALSLDGYKICEIGDIAANTMWLWAGAIGVSEYHGVISPSYNVYRQRSEHFLPKYLDHLLRAPMLVQEYASLSTGIRASRLRLYPKDFLNINFPVPPIEEQQAVLDSLSKKFSGIDQLIAIKQEKIEKLEQYKRSLIYEYVTGKREVM